MWNLKTLIATIQQLIAVTQEQNELLREQLTASGHTPRTPRTRLSVSPGPVGAIASSLLDLAAGTPKVRTAADVSVRGTDPDTGLAVYLPAARERPRTPTTTLPATAEPQFDQPISDQP
jgi:hypothetical protein